MSHRPPDAEYVPYGADDWGKFTRLKVVIYCAVALTNATAEQRQQTTLVLDGLQKAARSAADAEIVLYRPDGRTAPGSMHTPSEVYRIDHDAAFGADAMVFVVIGNSLGAGIEAQIAANGGSARILIHQHQDMFSAMFEGLFGPHIRVYYGSASELQGNLSNRLSELVSEIGRAAEGRRAALRQVESFRLREQLLKARLLAQKSVDQLSLETDIAAWWCEALERSEFALATLTLLQFTRLCEALECRLVTQDGHWRLEPHADNGIEQKALRFAQDLLALPRSVYDPEVLDRWLKWSGVARRIQTPSFRAGRLERPIRVYLVGAMSSTADSDEAILSQLREAVARVNRELCEGVVEVVDPAILQPSKPAGSRRDFGPEIYDTQHRVIRECDAVLVLAHPPALGVGIASQVSCDVAMPRLLVRPQAEISRMLLGCPARTIGEVSYVGAADCESSLGTAWSDWMDEIGVSAARRRAAVARVELAGVGRSIVLCRANKQMAVGDVAKVANIGEHWLKVLENEPSAAGAVTLVQLARLATCLEAEVVSGPDGVPKLHPILSRSQQESFNNLVSTPRFDGEAEVLVAAWSEYRREDHTRPGEESRGGKVVTRAEWATRLLRWGSGKKK